MSEIREKIGNFVDEIIKNNDYALLDVLWTLSYSIPSMSGYLNNKEAFNKWLGTICKRTLQKKYNLTPTGVKEKMRILIDFLNSLPDFLSKETFDEDDKFLREVLTDKSSNLLVQNIKNELQNLSELDKKILSFVLNYIPVKIQDSMKEAEKRKQEYPGYEDKYAILFDFCIKTDRETGDVAHFEIGDLKKWTDFFNRVFNEDLKEEKLIVKQDKVWFFPQPPLEYNFWQLGDEMAKIGIGYWTFYISGRGNVQVNFTIPNFIYESVNGLKESLPIIDR